MKNSLIIFSGLLFSAIMITITGSNCKKRIDKIFTEKYTYINQSKQDILFVKYYKKKIIKIPLQKGETITQTAIFPTLGDLKGVDSCIACVDSVRVIFGNKKVSFFKDNNTPNNKFNVQNKDNHKIISQSKNGLYSHREYIFTEADYNNATDCKGKCE